MGSRRPPTASGCAGSPWIREPLPYRSSGVGAEAMGMNLAKTAVVTTAAPRLPDALRLRGVERTAAHVDRSVAWYQSALGLGVHRHEVGVAELGDGAETVIRVLD